MNTSTHSPLPWFINELTGTEIGFTRYDETRFSSKKEACESVDGDPEIVSVADLEATAGNLDNGTEEAKANTAFIVRAVNSHDDLVASLKAMLAFVGMPSPDSCPEMDEYKSVYQAAQTAIENATKLAAE